VIIRFGPAGVMKANFRRAVTLFQLKPEPRSLPIRIRLRELNFELAIRNLERHLRKPIVSRTEPERVLGAFVRSSRRVQRPPRIEAGRGRHSFEDSPRRSLDRKMLKDVGQEFS